jgi:hypothetical protein
VIAAIAGARFSSTQTQVLRTKPPRGAGFEERTRSLILYRQILKRAALSEHTPDTLEVRLHEGGVPMKVIGEALRQPFFTSERSPDVEYTASGIPNDVHALRARCAQRLTGHRKRHLRLADESAQKDLDFVSFCHTEPPSAQNSRRAAPSSRPALLSPANRARRASPLQGTGAHSPFS